MEGEKNDLHKVFGEWFMISFPRWSEVLWLPSSAWASSEEQRTWTSAEHCEVTGPAQEGRIARGRGEAGQATVEGGAPQKVQRSKEALKEVFLTWKSTLQSMFHGKSKKHAVFTVQSLF